MTDKVKIDDVELVLSHPETQESEWIGQEELRDQVLASWLVIADDDLPLCPRLIGKPGVGKTTLAYAAARSLGQPVYILQCTMDTRPEDLLVTPVLDRDRRVSYHASPLVSAMITGGIVILDEANRMSEKSWASLAPLLDHRRYIESIVAGIKIRAHKAFRCCVTMNDDASTYEIPDYMLSRIQPAVIIGFPDREEEMRILRYNIPFAPEELLQLTVDFLQAGHAHDLDYTTRDGINIMRYALKRRQQDPSRGLEEAFEESVVRMLGEEALDHELASRHRQTHAPPPEVLDFESFFMSEDDIIGESDEDEDEEDGF